MGGSGHLVWMCLGERAERALSYLCKTVLVGDTVLPAQGRPASLPRSSDPCIASSSG